MEQSTAQRRLVKSPPELWAEVSSEDALARRLAPFGEIRITRVDPETTVAWEGERASGTVELAPAGWGTQVTLTATPMRQQEEAPPAPQPDPPPPPHGRSATPPAPREPRPGFLARLLRRRAPTPVTEPAAPPPEPLAPPAPVAPAPVAAQPQLDGARATAILTDVLDDLGAAHHRPFSRD